MTNTINKGSYAQYPDFNQFSYRCISYLMEHNELIWKLLYYTTPDAWNKTNLTIQQKTSLIYNGSDDSSKFAVFMDSGQPDVVTREDTILRISPHAIFPTNRTVGNINLNMEAYSHYKINTLSNYTTRVDTIMQELIQVFNGINIGGIGRLFFDRIGSFDNRLEGGGQLPHKGKWMIWTNKST